MSVAVCTFFLVKGKFPAKSSTYGAEIGEVRKMKVSNAKPIEAKAGIQMFVQMQGHGVPGRMP